MPSTATALTLPPAWMTSRMASRRARWAHVCSTAAGHAAQHRNSRRAQRLGSSLVNTLTSCIHTTTIAHLTHAPCSPRFRWGWPRPPAAAAQWLGCRESAHSARGVSGRGTLAAVPARGCSLGASAARPARPGLVASVRQSAGCGVGAQGWWGCCSETALTANAGMRGAAGGNMPRPTANPVIPNTPGCASAASLADVCSVCQQRFNSVPPAAGCSQHERCVAIGSAGSVHAQAASLQAKRTEQVSHT